MRNNPPPLHLPLAVVPNQPQERMECPARLESANALEILAFEEEAQTWLDGRLAVEGSSC